MMSDNAYLAQQDIPIVMGSAMIMANLHMFWIAVEPCAQDERT